MTLDQDVETVGQEHKDRNCPELTLDGPCKFCRALDRILARLAYLEQPPNAIAYSFFSHRIAELEARVKYLIKEYTWT